MKKVKALLLSVFVMALLLTLIMQPTTSFAVTSASKVELTTPPPSDIALYGYFDPNYKYLKEGNTTIKAKGDQKVILNADTSAFSRVDSLGAIFYLQKWDGKQWITVGDGVSKSKKDDFIFSDAVEKVAEKGYYYRTKAVHWIQMGNVSEEGVSYSNSVLAE